MGISFGSINTGLPKNIVQKIMEAERLPIKQMEKRKAKIDAKKGLVQELTTLVQKMRDELRKNLGARNLRELKFETNNDLIGVQLDKNVAQPGNYQIEVAELAQKSSAMSTGVSDKDNTYLGVGFIQYELPNGESKEVYVDSEHSSLEGIAKLINRDESNGMRASVYNDGSDGDKPWRLILALEKTGDANMADFPYFYFVDGEEDLYLEKQRTAHDAEVRLDGFPVQVEENKIKEVIPGVTIDLKKAKPGEEFSLNITEDIDAVNVKLKDIIDKVNAVLSFITAQNNLDENTDTTQTLGGDILLQTLESRIRSALFKTVKTSSGDKRAGDLGIVFQRNGLLKFDEKKFKSILSQDYQAVTQVLAGTFTKEGGKVDGFIDNIYKTANLALKYPAGVLPSRKKGLESKQAQIDRRIEQRERRLAQKEKMLKDKFARLESTINNIKSQGAGISGLASNASSPIQQLTAAG